MNVWRYVRLEQSYHVLLFCFFFVALWDAGLPNYPI